MGWDAVDAEDLAATVYRLAKADPTDPPGPRLLAKALKIEIRTSPRPGHWGPAELCHMLGEPVIFLAPRLPKGAVVFGIAHELAEWAARKEGRRDDDLEALCNAAAGAIIAPPPAFRSALSAWGPDLQRLAAAFVVSETCAALRIGEATGAPLALVAPERVRVRGDAWEWGGERELRRLAKAPALPENVERVRLVDDRRRVMLRVAALRTADAAVT